MRIHSASGSVYDYFGFFRRGLIFQVTLRCPLECAHCIVDSGPLRTEEASTERAVQWLEDIGRDGQVKVVALTGGEPFLNLGRLRALLAAAERHGLKISIVTSCSWATDPDRALRLLRDLPPIANVTLSADKYHLDYVPLVQVRHAAEAALALGIEVGAFLCLENEADDFPRLFRATLGEELHAKLRVETRHVHVAGRAARVASIARAVERVPFHELPSQGCEAAAAPAILPDGRVMACCGGTMADPERWPALTIGNLNRESIGEILRRANRHRLVHALRLLGPKALADIAQEDAGETLFRRRYERHNICDICRDLCTNPQIVARLEAYLDRPEVAAGIASWRLLRYGEETPPDAEAACVTTPAETRCTSP